MRQAWDSYCTSLGMLSYPLANHSMCWFLRNGILPGNIVRFKDQFGVERSKVLVGHSPRRAVYWHFGVEARANMVDRSLRLVPHVLFSDDGVTPIPSVDRQHALRRGFCRSWWNARWRDLLIAMLTYMSRGDDKIRLPVSENDFITVSARLHVYDATIEAARKSPRTGPVKGSVAQPCRTARGGGIWTDKRLSQGRAAPIRASVFQQEPVEHSCRGRGDPGRHRTISAVERSVQCLPQGSIR